MGICGGEGIIIKLVLNNRIVWRGLIWLKVSQIGEIC
jgi:hypothetical protein